MVSLSNHKLRAGKKIKNQNPNPESRIQKPATKNPEPSNNLNPLALTPVSKIGSKANLPWHDHVQAVSRGYDRKFPQRQHFLLLEYAKVRRGNLGSWISTSRIGEGRKTESRTLMEHDYRRGRMGEIQGPRERGTVDVRSRVLRGSRATPRSAGLLHANILSHLHEPLLSAVQSVPDTRLD